MYVYHIHASLSRSHQMSSLYPMLSHYIPLMYPVKTTFKMCPLEYIQVKKEQSNISPQITCIQFYPIKDHMNQVFPTENHMAGQGPDQVSAPCWRNWMDRLRDLRSNFAQDVLSTRSTSCFSKLYTVVHSKGLTFWYCLIGQSLLRFMGVWCFITSRLKSISGSWSICMCSADRHQYLQSSRVSKLQVSHGGPS